MSGTFNRRLGRLERDAEIKRAAMMKENEYDIEAMHLSYEDRQLVHVISPRSDPLKTCTPEEQAVLERFSAEYQRAFKLVSSRRRP